MIRSYELGVLFLQSFSSEPSRFCCHPAKDGSIPPWINSELLTGPLKLVNENDERTQGRLIPMSYNWNPGRYESSDRPWIWDVQYAEPDIHGAVRM